MNRSFLLLPFFFIFVNAYAQQKWELTSDSLEQEGVPKGEILTFEFDQSEIFPGTTREVSVYVPAQYDASKPACLYVNQDGEQYNASTVFNNLIHKGEMPVTIGVFARPGRVIPADPETQVGRINRSFEYDTISDDYAEFLQTELLPAVEKMQTSDGRPIRISKRATDRMIAGNSSGGIAAFMAAFSHPEYFSRVFTSVGTYVSMRGADQIAGLVRKYEPKPLRVFLQDGSNDINAESGDWWMSNQMMQRALDYAGYEVKHSWGDGGHNREHSSAVFPDAMRWLWKDWPALPQSRGTGNRFISRYIDPSEDWELVGEGFKFTEGPVYAPSGEVFFNDLHTRTTYKIDAEGDISVWMAESERANGQAYGPDGRRYTVAANVKEVWAFDADGNKEVVATGIRGNDIVVSAKGNIYITEPVAPGVSRSDRSRVWLVRPNGEKVELDYGIKFANGIALSPDQTQLYVADDHSKWIYGFMVQEDGTVAHKQRMVWLHHQDSRDESDVDGIRMDTDGNIWAATNMGIQICDVQGRPKAIIPVPSGKIASLCFAGPNMDILYATCFDKVYRRKVKATGVQSWMPPFKPGE